MCGFDKRRLKKIAFIFILLGFLSKAGNPPAIIFKENKGQWPEKVLFGAEFLNTKFYVNKNSFNYCVYNNEDLKRGKELHHIYSGKSSALHGHNYEVNLVGANLNSVSKTKEQKEYYNYFLGNNRSKWASEIKAYEDLLYNEIYEGIDLRIYSNALNLKYDFIVKPGANVNSLRLNYKYIEEIKIVNKELVIKTSVGIIIEKEPFAYQTINGKQKNINCKYTLLKNNVIGFEFPEGYNKNYELTIDPTVVVCSYSGFTGTGANSACGYDDNGNIYVTGWCGAGYPVSTGAFSIVYSGYYDIALSKYNSTGSSKIYSTYLGGDSIELVKNILIKNNQIIIAGVTNSHNYPCSINAFDSTHNGLGDLCVTKLNLSGNLLLASTYIGGSKNDGLNLTGPSIQGNVDYMRNTEMVCDGLGDVFVISTTASSNFPVSSGAISNTIKGNLDACVFKFNNTLTTLLWSTYLGGTHDETGKGIRIESTGGVYVLGTTTSTNFPTTASVISQTKSGVSISSDIFVSHINSNGTSLIQSTYLGTSANDYGGLLDIDQNNDLYICGNVSVPSGFISSSGTFSNLNGFNTIYKINPGLNTIIYNTKFGFNPPPMGGSSPYLNYSAFKVDSCQNLYIGGFGQNYFPTTANQLMPFAGGMSDLYIAVFNANCSSLKFGSFWGGSTFDHSDGGVNYFDSKGCLYHALCSNSGLPTTSNAYCQTFTSSGDSIYNDAFVKIDLQIVVNANSSYGANIIGCPPFTPTFVSTTNTGTTYWSFGNGVTSTQDTASTTYTNLGTYNVLLLVTDTTTCN